MLNETRYCADIGMFALDRSREVSCLFATAFCKRTCFNIKIERLFHKSIPPKDLRNDIFWDQLNGDRLKVILDRKKKPVERFRGCTRGDNVKDRSDVFKWRDIAVKNPETIFWLPTKAWRSDKLRALIKRILFPIPNIRMNASVDPDTTNDKLQMLKSTGWSMMYYGDDNRTSFPFKLNVFKCPKTWHHKHFKKINRAPCQTCSKGCFNTNQSFVHLKQH